MNKRIVYGALGLIIRLLLNITLKQRPSPKFITKATALADECDVISDATI